MKKRFLDKTIFITGASSGIGEALAKAFSKEGGKVICVARRMDRLRSLLTEIERDGGQGLTLPCDVTRDGDLENAVQQGVDNFGGIDVVVANAGAAVAGLFENLSVDDYRNQMETNLFGVLRTIYATLPELKKTKGTLVLIGSFFSFLSLPFSSPYAMSKFALRALADSLRQEFARHGISVVFVSAGFVKSEIRNSYERSSSQGGFFARIIPWLDMPTDRCAATVLKATYKRKPFQVVTGHARILLFLKKKLRFPFGPISERRFGEKAFPAPGLTGLPSGQKT